MQAKLPEPDDNAKAHSLVLQAKIKQLIANQGKISFHDFMKLALYEPGLGYYSAGSLKLGAEGDFITAPELSPLFGMSIAKSILHITPELKQANWLELGAGTGRLAASILQYLQQQNALPENYFILEVSADLKQRQQQYLQAQLSESIFNKIIWLDTLPENFTGIIIGNEVLDALPTHRFRTTATGVEEAYICLNDQQQFEQCFAKPSSELLSQRIASLNLAENYISEINLQQEALLKSLNSCLQHGVILFIDYGFSSKEYYHPQRNEGTLMCHYRHHAHADPLFWPGLQDITAHVDFTALATCAIKDGLSLISFNTQSAWLLQAGILELAQAQTASCNEREQLKTSQALRKLLSPEEMGELFKVILFGKQVEAVAMDDIRYRL